MTIKGPDTLKTGIFVAAAIFMFIFSIYFLGSEREIFSKQADYYVLLSDVKGLSIGAPVRLGGVIIGRVNEIDFASNESDLEVIVSINEKYLDRIRLDSRVSLETAGLLGDKFVSISVGKDPLRAPPGSSLLVSTEADTSELLGKAAKVVDNTVQISDDIRTLTESVRGENADDLKNTVHEFRKLVSSLSAIVKEVEKGDGLIHALVYDKSGAGAVKSVAQISKNLEETSREIETITKDIKSGNGVLKDLIYNNEGPDAGLNATLKKLNATAENLRIASESLKNGSGSIGALLVDSKIYDNLVEVTDGAKRSFILRQAIRSSLNNSE